MITIRSASTWTSPMRPPGAESQKSKPMRLYVENYHEDWITDWIKHTKIFQNAGGGPEAQVTWFDTEWNENGGL